VTTAAFTLNAGLGLETRPMPPRQVTEQLVEANIYVGWESLRLRGHHALWFGGERWHGVSGSGALQHAGGYPAICVVAGDNG